MKQHASNILFKFLVFIFLLNLWTIQVCGQEVQPEKKPKNSFQIGGFTYFFWGGFSLNYERSVLQSGHYNLNINVGYGGYYYLEDIFTKTCKGPTVSGQLNSLFGSKKSFFELSLGYRYIDFSKYYPTDWFNAYFPVISIGYRYQAQINKLGSVFRVYVGTDGFGISFGLGF